MPSPILGITEINQAQASKYLTANEAFRRLEQGAQHFVAIDRDLTVPPGTPADGDAYIVGPGATGLWAGHANEIAYYLNGVWKFIAPREWMTASLLDEDVTVRWDGAAWVTAYAAYHQNNFTAVADPGVNDDSSAGYSIGSKWLNTVTTEVFLCLDANVGAAHWESATLTIDELGTAATAGIKRSVEIDSGDLQLVGDQDAPGNNKVYGTDAAGNRIWRLAYVSSLFAKSSPDTVAWSKTGNFTAETAQALSIEVSGMVYEIAAATSITMPGSPAAGTDYVIWIHPDGTLEATSSYVTPPVTDARRIGGFHYAPGGNASAQSGGNTTAQINEYSFWDLKWRPACDDPRGMTLVAGNFWADIYLLGVDHHVNGTSAHGVTIADGASSPKLPDEFGGDGTSVYSNANWWSLAEVLAAHGKRLPSYAEFAALAYGTSEAVFRGNDSVTTGISDSNIGTNNTDEKFTSRWGVIQSTGVMYIWGSEFGGSNPDAAAGVWENITQGRGQTYEVDNVVLFGGHWSLGVQAGSRCSNWGFQPSNSGGVIGARGCSDHLRLV